MSPDSPPPRPRSPTAYHSTGFFRTMRRKGDSFELVFKNMSSDITITVAYNIPLSTAEELKNQLNDILHRNDSVELLSLPQRGHHAQTPPED